MRSKVESLIKGTSLHLKEVTGSTTGYPEPIVGIVVLGFDDFSEAQTFAQINEAEVIFTKWKAGWTFVNEYGKVFHKPTVSDFPLFKEDRPSFYNSEKSLVESTLWWTHSEIEEMDEEELKDATAKEEEVEAILETIDWTTSVVMEDEGHELQIVEKHPMQFAYDSSYVQVGVYFKF